MNWCINYDGGQLRNYTKVSWPIEYLEESMVIECLYQLERLLYQGYMLKWFSIHGLKAYIVLNTYQ